MQIKRIDKKIHLAHVKFEENGATAWLGRRGKQ